MVSGADNGYGNPLLCHLNSFVGNQMRTLPKYYFLSSALSLFGVLQRKDLCVQNPMLTKNPGTV